MSFDQQQVIEIKTDTDFDLTCFDLALKDLCLWLENIYALQNLRFFTPKFLIKQVKNFSGLSQSVKVDFGLYKRWTDENTYASEVIFVRTDYFDFLKEGSY